MNFTARGTMAEVFDLGTALEADEKDQAGQLYTDDKADVDKLIPGRGLFRDYLSFTSTFSEAPPVFHIFTMAHTVSCILGRSLWIQQGMDRVYPNLFTLLVAPSSLYKKSSSADICPKMLGRLSLFKDRWLGKIGSPEGLFNGLKENNGFGCLYYPELGTLLAHSGAKYMEGVLDMLNELYDCPDFFSKTMAGGSRTAENVFLNVLAASQLDSMGRYIKESALLSGFLPRFTVVFSEALQPHLTRRPAPNKQLEAKILKQLNDINTAAKHPQEITLTSGAWSKFDTWGQEQFKRAMVAPPEVQPMYGRIETHCLKYALIISLGVSPTTAIIDAETLDVAINWADFVIESYTRLVLEELAFTDDDRRVKKVAKIIRSKGSASKRDIVTSTRYKARDLEDVIRTLVVMGKIKQAKGPRGGLVYNWIDRN
ncbi:MAG: DUF3987 domain-containing protein [Thermodesulfobacteriota bacterium]|nr:DUF3987 domain-containing protein [Thermodesulfobacteriota bacterium]